MSTPSSPMSTSYTSESCLSSITDPTDFPQKPLQLFDTFPRCPICKEFFRTPTIGECGHIYCSFCILRTLAIERNCPICKKKLSDYQLYKSITTENIVDCWKDVRKTILSEAKKEEYCRKKGREYTCRPDATTSARTTSSNPKNKPTSCLNGKKGANGLEYAYLHTPKSTPYEKQKRLHPTYMEFCIQQ